MKNSHIKISYDVMPESRHWANGKNYRVKLVLNQKASSETGAEFEIIDATSLEASDLEKKKFMSSDSGTYLGK